MTITITAGIAAIAVVLIDIFLPTNVFTGYPR